MPAPRSFIFYSRDGNGALAALGAAFRYPNVCRSIAANEDNNLAALGHLARKQRFDLALVVNARSRHLFEPPQRIDIFENPNSGRWPLGSQHLRIATTHGRDCNQARYEAAHSPRSGHW